MILNYLMLCCRAEEKSLNTKVWNRNGYAPLSNTKDSRPESGIIQKFENLSNTVKTVQQQKPHNNHNSSQHLKTAENSQTSTSKGQWPTKPNTVSRSLQDHSLAYKFTYNIQQNKINENKFDCVPEDKCQVNLWRELIGKYNEGNS